MPRGYKRIASGGHIAAKRMLTCEVCNFMELYQAKGKLKTGSKCPRCKNPTLRVFDSKAEFGRARELMIQRDNGEIVDLVFQPKFPLHAGASDTFLYDYVSDFSYTTNKGEFFVEDVKGSSRGKAIMTDVAEMKIKHFEAEYGIPVLITLR